MELIFFLAPFVVLGIGVLFVAFSGGPGRARQAYLTGGRRSFRLALVLVYVALGVAIPLLVITGREESVGASGSLAATEADADLEEGKTLFLQNCSSCHSLDAANARGVTGPDLDALAPLEEDRVLSAIEIGGTGENRMPAGLLEGENADLVAAYVSEVAGR
jgi:mono/diheme cytochrome c family protein